MKKLIVLLTVLALVVLLSACQTQTPTQITEPPVTAPPETEPPETEPQKVEVDYTALECSPIDGWKDIGIKWENSGQVLVSKFPKNWELAPLVDEEDTTLVVLRDGVDIGVVSTLVPQASLDTLESANYVSGEIELDYDVRKVKEGNSYGFRRILAFFWGDYRVFFELDYTEIDDEGCRYIASSIAEGGETGGSLIIPTENGNSSRNVIVIGNSFIRTSQIGDYLKHFQNNGKKYYNIQTFTHNGQSVEDYAKESWLTQYRNGDYHVVFLCGLYNTRDVESFPKVLEACKQSNTKLVVFPAHNEVYGRVETVLEQYPDVYYLSWRDEVDFFIDNGEISYWDFCRNDGDKHSTPLAGYIGAHMVYTALYGEVPPEYTSSTPHSIGYIKSKLGEDYVKTGIAPGERVYTVYNLVD